jgi:hypothetical protein
MEGIMARRRIGQQAFRFGAEEAIAYNIKRYWRMEWQ